MKLATNVITTEITDTPIITGAIIRITIRTAYTTAVKPAAFITSVRPIQFIPNITALKSTILAMTKSIPTNLIMVRNTLGNQGFKGIMAFTLLTAPIIMDFQTDPMAKLTPVEAIPGGDAPHRVHGAIRRPSATKDETKIQGSQKLLIVQTAAD
jgi:hypothetical protein